VPAEEPANETVAPRPLSTLVDTLRAATVRS
jgi:hypothetical protein